MSSTSVIIVTYNSRQLLLPVLSSVLSQEKKAEHIFCVDNGSQDGSVECIQKNWPQVEIIQNSKNVWFSQAVNQALAKTTTDYALLLNHDAVLEPSTIKNLSMALDSQPKAGASFGKILRDNGTIDAFGIQATRSRRFYNLGEGKTSIDIPKKTFGFSGGLVLLRMKALKEITWQAEILDEDFVAYKDDVDLSYRLRLAGWDIVGIPATVGKHERSVKTPLDQSNLNVGKNRDRFSPVIRRNSTRNHLWLLLKNEPLSNLLLDLPWITWYELKKFGYILLADPKTLLAYAQAFRGVPRMLKKRQWIQAHRKIDPKTLRQLCRN